MEADAFLPIFKIAKYEDIDANVIALKKTANPYQFYELVIKLTKENQKEKLTDCIRALSVLIVKSQSLDYALAVSKLLIKNVNFSTYIANNLLKMESQHSLEYINTIIEFWVIISVQNKYLSLEAFYSWDFEGENFGNIIYSDFTKKNQQLRDNLLKFLLAFYNHNDMTLIQLVTGKIEFIQTFFPSLFFDSFSHISMLLKSLHINLFSKFHDIQNCPEPLKHNIIRLMDLKTLLHLGTLLFWQENNLNTSIYIYSYEGNPTLIKEYFTDDNLNVMTETAQEQEIRQAAFDIIKTFFYKIYRTNFVDSERKHDRILQFLQYFPRPYFLRLNSSTNPVFQRMFNLTVHLINLDVVHYMPLYIQYCQQDYIISPKCPISYDWYKCFAILIKIYDKTVPVLTINQSPNQNVADQKMDEIINIIIPQPFVKHIFPFFTRYIGTTITHLPHLSFKEAIEFFIKPILKFLLKALHKAFILSSLKNDTNKSVPLNSDLSTNISPKTIFIMKFSKAFVGIHTITTLIEYLSQKSGFPISLEDLMSNSDFLCLAKCLRIIYLMNSLCPYQFNVDLAEKHKVLKRIFLSNILEPCTIALGKGVKHTQKSSLICLLTMDVLTTCSYNHRVLVHSLSKNSEFCDDHMIKMDCLNDETTMKQINKALPKDLTQFTKLFLKAKFYDYHSININSFQKILLSDKISTNHLSFSYFFQNGLMDSHCNILEFIFSSLKHTNRCTKIYVHKRNRVQFKENMITLMDSFAFHVNILFLHVINDPKNDVLIDKVLTQLIESIISSEWYISLPISVKTNMFSVPMLSFISSLDYKNKLSGVFDKLSCNTNETQTLCCDIKSNPTPINKITNYKEFINHIYSIIMLDVENVKDWIPYIPAFSITLEEHMESVDGYLCYALLSKMLTFFNQSLQGETVTSNIDHVISIMRICIKQAITNNLSKTIFENLLLTSEIHSYFCKIMQENDWKLICSISNLCSYALFCLNFGDDNNDKNNNIKVMDMEMYDKIYCVLNFGLLFQKIIPDITLERIRTIVESFLSTSHISLQQSTIKLIEKIIIEINGELNNIIVNIDDFINLIRYISIFLNQWQNYEMLTPFITNITEKLSKMLNDEIYYTQLNSNHLRYISAYANKITDKNNHEHTIFNLWLQMASSEYASIQNPTFAQECILRFVQNYNRNFSIYKSIMINYVDTLITQSSTEISIGNLKKMETLLKLLTEHKIRDPKQCGVMVMNATYSIKILLTEKSLIIDKVKIIKTFFQAIFSYGVKYLQKLKNIFWVDIQTIFQNLFEYLDSDSEITIKISIMESIYYGIMPFIDCIKPSHMAFIEANKKANNYKHLQSVNECFYQILKLYCAKISSLIKFYHILLDSTLKDGEKYFCQLFIRLWPYVEFLANSSKQTTFSRLIATSNQECKPDAIIHVFKSTLKLRYESETYITFLYTYLRYVYQLLPHHTPNSWENSFKYFSLLTQITNLFILHSSFGKVCSPESIVNCFKNEKVNRREAIINLISECQKRLAHMKLLKLLIEYINDSKHCPGCGTNGPTIDNNVSQHLCLTKFNALNFTNSEMAGDDNYKNAVSYLQSYLYPLLINMYVPLLTPDNEIVLDLLQTLSQSPMLGSGNVLKSPFFWGPKAIQHLENKGEMSSLWNHHQLQEEIFDVIDAETMKISSKHYPINVFLFNFAYSHKGSFGRHSENVQPCYDPRYILPLLYHISSQGNVLNITKFIWSGCMDYTISALASYDTDCRKLSLAICDNIYNQLFTYDSHFKPRQQMLFFLKLLQNSITPEKRVPNFIVSFWRETLNILQNPANMLFNPTIKVLVINPFLLTSDITSFDRYMFGTNPEEAKIKIFILRCIRDGIRDKNDCKYIRQDKKGYLPMLSMKARFGLILPNIILPHEKIMNKISCEIIKKCNAICT